MGTHNFFATLLRFIEIGRARFHERANAGHTVPGGHQSEGGEAGRVQVVRNAGVHAGCSPRAVGFGSVVSE